MKTKTNFTTVIYYL